MHDAVLMGRVEGLRRLDRQADSSAEIRPPGSRPACSRRIGAFEGALPPRRAARLPTGSFATRPLPAIGNRPVERLALDELHRVVMDAPLHAHGKHGNDVRMVQLRGRLGLVLEAGDLPAVEHGGKGKHFQRHAAAQRNLLRLIDHAHASAADLPQEAEVAQPLGVRRRGGSLRIHATGRAVKAGRHVVQLVETVEVRLQRPGQVRMRRQQFFPGRRQPPLQDRKIAVENVRQTVFLLGRQIADGRGLDAQVLEVKFSSRRSMLKSTG